MLVVTQDRHGQRDIRLHADIFMWLVELGYYQARARNGHVGNGFTRWRIP